MKVLIIDSSYLAYKSHFAFSKKQLSVQKGNTEILTSAVFGFINEITNLYTQHGYDKFITVWDTPPYLKKKIYPDYKLGRKSNIPALHTERTLIKAILHDLGIPCVISPGYEGEEVAAAIMHQANTHAFDFYTNDEDCYALLSDNVRLINTGFDKATRKTDIHIFTDEDLLKKYNVTPKGFVQMKMLMGCKSDNVPGIDGIGPITASKLINRFGTAKETLNNAASIKKEKPAIAAKLQTALQNNTLQITRKLTKIEKPTALALLTPTTHNPFEQILDYIEATTFKTGNKLLALQALRKKHAQNIAPIVQSLKPRIEIYT